MHSNNRRLAEGVQRIAIISTSQYMEGGAEVVLRNLLRAYSSPQSIVLVCPRDSELDSVAVECGCEWVELPTGEDRALKNLYAVTRIIGKLRGVSLVHAWTRRAFETATIAGWKLGVPVTATMHDIPSAAFIGGIRRTLLSMCAGKMRSVVCVSEFLKRVVSDDWPRASTITILNGVPDFGADLRRANTGGSVRIGFAAMHHREKGFPVVAEWAETLLGEGLDVVFHLFGNVRREWIERVEAIRRRHPSRIVSHGYASVGEIFGNTDIFVQASYPFVETFGMVFAEAACAGVPTITSSQGAEVDIIEHGKSGFLFAPGDVDKGLMFLRRLVAEPELRSSMGTFARQLYVEKYTDEKMAAAYQNFWNSRIGIV